MPQRIRCLATSLDKRLEAEIEFFRVSINDVYEIVYHVTASSAFSSGLPTWFEPCEGTLTKYSSLSTKADTKCVEQDPLLAVVGVFRGLRRKCYGGIFVTWQPRMARHRNGCRQSGHRRMPLQRLLIRIHFCQLEDLLVQLQIKREVLARSNRNMKLSPLRRQSPSRRTAPTQTTLHHGNMARKSIDISCYRSQGFSSGDSSSDEHLYKRRSQAENQEHTRQEVVREGIHRASHQQQISGGSSGGNSGGGSSGVSASSISSDLSSDSDSS